MKDIKFCGRWEAEQFESSMPWAVISITDPGSENARLSTKNRVAVLRLKFHDLDRPYPGYEDDLFTPSMAREVIEFVTTWRPKIKTLLLHCEAGISRSAATAAFVAKITFGEDAEYFKRAIPNRLVYRTLLKEWEKTHAAAAVR